MVYSSEKIKSKAGELGFLQVGVAKARQLDKEARNLERWLKQGMHGEMSYMENYFEKRIDPSLLFPGCKSVIMLALNYFPESQYIHKEGFKISRYAYGQDYHQVIKSKLKVLTHWLNDTYGNIQLRYFVDSAPVLERDWAKISGISWSGKHTLSIHPKHGSYFFLACVLTDIEFQVDHPINDHCGTCTRCIEACPTDAIHAQGYIVDASRCISYLTIELKNNIPESFSGKTKGWIFGCDICQEVCPWNRFAKQHQVEEFEPKLELLNLSQQDWLAMTDEAFNELTLNSPIQRTKLKGMKRNVMNCIDKT